MKYEWVPIEGFPGYLIHPEIGVKSNRGLLRSQVNNSGYVYYSLRRDGRGHGRMAHRLIWESVFGKIPQGMQVNHIDFNRKNNSLSNLEIVSPQENVLHSIKAGRQPPIVPVVLINKKTNEVLRFKSSGLAIKTLGLRKGNFYFALSDPTRTICGWFVRKDIPDAQGA